MTCDNTFNYGGGNIGEMISCTRCGDTKLDMTLSEEDYEDDIYDDRGIPV